MTTKIKSVCSCLMMMMTEKLLKVDMWNLIHTHIRYTH